MKNIKDFFESNIIFCNIVKEAKESLQIVDMSFEEWLKELPNDKDGAEVVSISGLPTVDKSKNKVITLASISFISAINQLQSQIKEDEKYVVGIIVIPFENFYIVMQCKYYSSKLNYLAMIAVQPKIVSIKSVINGSRSIYKVYCNTYVRDGDSEKQIIEKIIKYANKQEFIDRNDNTASFVDGINKNFGTEAQEANVKSKEPTPDKSPFTLRKKKQFPEYIKHCIIYEKDNAIVKKYSYWGEAEIFIETIKKDKKNYYKVYMGDVRSSFDNGHDEMYTFYLTTLGSLDKFLEYCLKPNRKKMHSELGADGEIHIWYSSMQKNLPSSLKKDCIKDENLIKELGFHNFELNDLYK